MGISSVDWNGQQNYGDWLAENSSPVVEDERPSCEQIAEECIKGYCREVPNWVVDRVIAMIRSAGPWAAIECAIIVEKAYATGKAAQVR